MSFLDQIVAATSSDAINQTTSETAPQVERIETDAEKRIRDVVDSLPQVSKIEFSNPVTGNPSGLYGCFTESGEPIGGTVKQNYQPTTLSQVSAIAIASAEAFEGDVEIKANLDSVGYRLQILPTKAERKTIFGTDTVFPWLSITAGIGGRAANVIQLGPARDACANLMLMRRLAKSYSTKIRHSLSHDGKMSQTGQDVSRLAKNFDNFVEELQLLQSETVNFSDLLQMWTPVKPATGIPTTQGLNTAAEIWYRLNRESVSLGLPIVTQENPTTSKWLAFNAVQGYLQHTKYINNPTKANESARLLEFEELLVAAH